MKVLITGAGGFLGLRLARALLNLDKLALEPDDAFAIDELVRAMPLEERVYRSMNSALTAASGNGCCGQVGG